MDFLSVLEVQCPAGFTTFQLEGDPKEYTCGHVVSRPQGPVRLTGELKGEGYVEGLESRGLIAVVANAPAPPMVVVLPAPEPVPEARPPGIAAASAPPVEPATNRAIGWSLVGTGAAALGAAAILHVLAFDAQETANRYADGEMISVDALDQNTRDRDRYDSLKRWTIGTYVAGALLGTAGLTVFAFD